jgi:hypothetical protein
VHLNLTVRTLGGAPSVLGGWILAVPQAGGSPLRVPWALGVPGVRKTDLIQAAALSRRVTFAGGAADATGVSGDGTKLTVAIGQAAGRGARLRIAPVAHLSVDLFKGDAHVARVLDARSLLPGVYRYAVTGRDRMGRPLPPGTYRIVIEAVSGDGVKTERSLPLVIKRPAKPHATSAGAATATP